MYLATTIVPKAATSTVAAVITTTITKAIATAETGMWNLKVVNHLGEN